MDEMREPFATAQVPRDRQYYAVLYRLLNHGYQWRWMVLWSMNGLMVLYGLFVVFKTGNLFLLVLVFGFAGLVFLTRWFQRWKWMRDRMGDLAVDRMQMDFQFFADKLVVFTGSSTGSIDWESMHRAVLHDEGLLIYPQRGIVFYIPRDCWQPPAAMGVVLQKINRK